MAWLEGQMNRTHGAIKQRARKKLGLFRPGKTAQPKWRPEEDAFMREHYPTPISIHWIAEQLGRTSVGCHSHAADLGIVRPKVVERPVRYNAWSKEDFAFAKQAFLEGKALEWIGEQVGRTADAVILKMNRTKVARRKLQVTHENKAAILLLPAGTTTVQAAQELGCSVSSIGRAREQLSLRKHEAWTTGDLKLLRQLYPGTSPKEIGLRLGRTEKAVIHVLCNLRLTKRRKEFTTPELLVAAALLNLGVDFKTQVRLYTGEMTVNFRRKYRCPDFVIEPDLIIEVQGDYFHCNPAKWPQGPINRIQQESVERDKVKKAWYASQGYRVMWLWESDCNIQEDLQQLLSTFIFKVSKTA